MRASSASLAESASCCAAVAHASDSSVAERVSVFNDSTLNSQYSLEKSKLEILRPTKHTRTDGRALDMHITPMQWFVKLACQ
jgi:hypothetical protein